MSNYDDELRIFLINCLRKIEYLKDDEVSDEILLHLAMIMKVKQQDKGALLFDSKDDSNQEREQMCIIFEGQLNVSVNLDTGTNVILDFLGKGAVINANNCLAQRRIVSDVKCMTAVSYY